MQRVIRSDTAYIHGYQHITIYVHSAFATNASLSILSVQPCMHPHTTQKSTQCTATRIERLQCHPGKSGGHVVWCL